MNIKTLYKIPDTWAWATIDDLGIVASGNTPSTKEEDNFSGDVPWLTPADLSEYQDKYIKRGRRNLTQKGLESSSATLLPRGTILFSSRAPIGYVVIADNPIATNQGFKNIISSKEMFNEYIYHYLKGNKTLAETYASGTTFKELSSTRIKKIPIPVPPYNGQIRIVSKIEELFNRLDQGVKALQQTQRQLEQYRQSTLKQAFTGKLTQKWRQDHKEIENVDVLIDNIAKEIKKLPIQRYKAANLDLDNLPILPGQWIWIQLGRAFYTILGQSPPSSTYNEEEDGLPFFQGSKEFQEIYPRVEKWCSKPNKIAEKDDVLISVRAPVGDVNIAPERCCIGRGLASIRALSGVEHKYIFYLIKYYQKDLDSRGTGTTFKAITGNVLRNYPIPLPPLLEINNIVAELERKDSIIKKVRINIYQIIPKSNELRQSILKKAFKGRLVPQDPSDEPASVLLERIGTEKAKLKLFLRRGRRRRRKN